MPTKLPPPAPDCFVVSGAIVELVRRRAISFTAYCLWLQMCLEADKQTQVITEPLSFLEEHPDWFTTADDSRPLTQAELQAAVTELVKGRVITVVREDVYELCRDYVRLS